MNGWNEDVSACCRARVETVGDICNGYWKKCTACGTTVYHPSDYEKALEARVAALEKLARRSRRVQPPV